MPDVVDLFHRAAREAGVRVHGLADRDWRRPTPCARWDVRQVVAHVVDEMRWVPPLLGGATIDEVGDSLAGDPLGRDPVRAWDDAVAAADAAAHAVDVDRIVHLSFGDVAASEYLWQLTTDLLVHAWDLSRATGQSEHSDPELVAACTSYFDGVEALYRSAGVIGAAVPATEDDPTSRLIARFGRDPSPTSPLAVVRRFDAAFEAHDLAGLGTLLADDAVFDDTTPPEGRTHRGRAAVLAAFDELFTASPDAGFDILGGAATEQGMVIRWRYRWGPAADELVRGVDLFEVADGRIARKDSYVKG
jgi:uncharacterized protein (TIGR03086 family)